jgi:hypothetical protein
VQKIDEIINASAVNIAKLPELLPERLNVDARKRERPLLSVRPPS